MALPTDPNFGSGFDAAAFRAAITSTLEMAAPNATVDKARFIWESTDSYAINNTDNAGNPYDLGATPTSSITHAEVQTNVAVTLVQHDPTGSAFGQIDHPRVELTLLDEGYELIRGADHVFLGDSKYVIDFVEPPVGLFTVDVYTIHAHAVDETS